MKAESFWVFVCTMVGMGLVMAGEVGCIKIINDGGGWWVACGYLIAMFYAAYRMAVAVCTFIQG